MKVVLDLQDRRPAWAMPAWVPDRIRAALPPGGRLVLPDALADGSGDGVAQVAPSVLAAVEDAEAYLGYGVSPEILRHGRRLVWIHSGAAGVGSSLSPELLASEVLFTNSAGVHGPAMAETVLGMILHFARGLDLAVREQGRGRWSAQAFYDEAVPLTEVSRSTVGIVGLGGIGRELARRVGALGARVLAVKRSGVPGGTIELPGLAGGTVPVRVGRGARGLAELLAESDYVALTAPHTPETAGLLDEEALGLLKRSAVLVNVSRGALVDQDALVRALAEGRLRGAALDVFATEPLPPGHPLWDLPNVLITPHVSAISGAFWERETELIVDNLARLAEGRPLRNQVDRRAGY